MVNKERLGSLAMNPLHKPLMELKKKNWNVDLEKLSADATFDQLLADVEISSSCVLHPRENRMLVGFKSQFKHPFPNASRPFLSHLKQTMQGKGILFVWEDALFRVKWDLIDEELFDPERVDDLSARLNWLLWSGQRFSLSCAHVLTDCFGGLLQTGKLSFKWISHKDLTDYCLAESIGTPLN